MNKNEIIPVNEVEVLEGFANNVDYVAQIESDSISYCSMKADTEEDKIKMFNALNGSSDRITDCINMELNIKDVYIETVVCKNEFTGEETTCPRTVLIDEDGKGYSAVSIGVFSSLKKLFQVFGTPTWEKPITIIPKQITKGDKKITTLSIKPFAKIKK